VLGCLFLDDKVNFENKLWNFTFLKGSFFFLEIIALNSLWILCLFFENTLIILFVINGLEHGLILTLNNNNWNSTMHKYVKVHILGDWYFNLGIWSEIWFFTTHLNINWFRIEMIIKYYLTCDRRKSYWSFITTIKFSFSVHNFITLVNKIIFLCLRKVG
jgi:hypothetical protein